MQTGLKSDNILGYRILQKIGSGGFGEVWKAEAPGGLLKAVKILYGFHDERRARDEMKSLDRIKQLRHPFLLSLERIEVVDKQLVVISELADRSLADVFDSYQRAGKTGIPREELLQYMRQAAEALDFLASEHGLQHLDVKPENLLLVGKHAKLADFGLVKDLRDGAESLMGGLTPAFSAPELFDGRPSLQSDQYALAIVYQEMLTGRRPFNGSTLAQLAGQHMHSPPDLSPLPKNDQSVVARSLAKNPEQRYPNCRSLIDDLVNQRSIARQSKRNLIPGRSGTGTVQQKGSLPSSDTSQTKAVQTASMTTPIANTELADAPIVPQASVAFGPTLIVGIGRTATGILQRVKQLIATRNQPLDQLPAIRLLAIDTERTESEGRAALGLHAQLTADEQVLLPLRRPEEYRTRSDRHKNWLNRRWIYNVPKSLQTEGLRPLGRLAMIDNFEVLYGSLESAVEQMARRDAIALTADRLAMDPQPTKPRVILISSISGGLGSGMTLDLAFAIRLLLEQHSLNADCLTGILMHSTHSSVRDSGIAVANSFSFLTELRHYTQRGYPGEETCGIPAMTEDLPIDFPYFIHLGDNTAREEWEQRLDSIAEYVYLNSVSSGSAFFDSCRERESDFGHFALRSFGVESVGPSHPDCQRQLAEFVRNHLVLRWKQKPDAGEMEHRLRHFSSSISRERLESPILEHIDKTYPPSRLSSIGEQMAAWAVKRSLPDELLSELTASADELLGEAPRDAKAVWAGLNEDLQEDLQRQAQPLCQVIDRFAIDTLSGRSLSLGSSLAVLAAMQESVENQRAELTTRIVSHAARNTELLNTLKAMRVKPSDKAEFAQLAAKSAQEWTANRLDQIRARLVSEVLLHVQRRLTTHRTEVNRIAEEIFGVVQSRDGEMSEKALARRFNGLQQALVADLLTGLDRIVDGVEERLFVDLAKPAGSYWKQLQNAGFIRRYLPEAVSVAIRSELAWAGRDVDLDRVLSNALDAKRFSIADELRAQLTRAMPALKQCGGTSRLLIGLPRCGNSSRMTEEIGAISGVKAMISPSTCGDLLMATEAEDVSLASVAYRLLATRSDCLELSRRLQSRSDVQWQSLEDLL